MAVAQTCLAADVCCVSFPAGNSFVPGFRSIGGTSRLLKHHVWGSTCYRGGGFWGWRGGLWGLGRQVAGSLGNRDKTTLLEVPTYA
jgi:hypothetical protein